LIQECRLFIHFIGIFSKIDDNNNCSNFLSSIIDNLSFYEKNPLNILDMINSSLKNNLKFDLLLLNEVSVDKYKKLYLELIEPSIVESNIETPINFTPGLICNIKIKAFLYNFNRFDHLYCQVSLI
jgi:hypothetical protein